MTPAFLAASPLYAWLYNVAGRFPFAAVLYHALGDLARGAIADASVFAEVGVEMVMALVVALAA
ncbi:MAG: hypothetical protein H5T74_00510 [Actinobacteria bacterium]|nr:hypothetical protein [Actinomycetota bacterium]